MTEDLNPGPAQSQLCNQFKELLEDREVFEEAMMELFAPPPERFVGRGLEDIIELQRQMNEIIDERTKHINSLA